MRRIHSAAGLIALAGGLLVWAAPLAAQQASPKAKVPAAGAADKAQPKVNPAQPKVNPAQAKANPAQAKLNAKQSAYLKNELLPAYDGGNPLELIRVISEQIFRQSDQQTAALNQALAEQGAPSLGRMLTDARMNLARLNVKSAPEMTLPEMVLILGELERQVNELIATAKKVELFADPLPSPASLTGYRDLLWSAHVQNNELINAAFLTAQARSLLQSPLIPKVKNPTPAQKAAFSIDFAKLQADIQTLHRDLNERTIELRVNRVVFALNLLESSTDLTQRFLAAYAVGIDGELLHAGFKNFTGQFQREKLRSPTLVTELRSNVDHGKELAGDLIKKSELLFTGLHWWRRGRYGRGPEGNGLLKSAAALANPNAQIALFMPRVSPVPTDPAKGGKQSPDHDRRHHWTWAWEDRQFETVGAGSSSNSSTQVSTQNRDISKGHFDGHVDGTFY